MASQLKKDPARFHTKEDLEVAANFLREAVKDSFEINYSLEPKNASKFRGTEQRASETQI